MRARHVGLVEQNKPAPCSGSASHGNPALKHMRLSRVKRTTISVSVNVIALLHADYRGAGLPVSDPPFASASSGCRGVATCGCPPDGRPLPCPARLCRTAQIRPVLEYFGSRGSRPSDRLHRHAAPGSASFEVISSRSDPRHRSGTPDAVNRHDERIPARHQPPPCPGPSDGASGPPGTPAGMATSSVLPPGMSTRFLAPFTASRNSMGSV